MQPKTTLKIKQGQLVKFKNADGTLGGGYYDGNQIIEGESKIFVKLFDGKKALIPEAHLIIIKHQRGTQPSNNMIKKVIGEIKAHNTNLELYGSGLKTLEEKHDILVSERNNLLSKINQLNEKIQELENSNLLLEEQLETSNNQIAELEVALKDAQSDKTSECQLLSKEVADLKETVESLSNCIILIKSNSEKDAFEYILSRIKKFHHI